MIIELTEQDFTRGIIRRAQGSGGMVIFKADWCGYCVRTLPELEKVATQTGTIYPIYKVDVDKNPKITKELGITGFPTIFFVNRDGSIGDKYIDERSSRKFLKEICNKTKNCY